MVICLERGADLHMAQLMPLPLTISCFGKIQIGFTFLIPAPPGSPGQRAFKRMCVCVCVRACWPWKYCKNLIHLKAQCCMRQPRLFLVIYCPLCAAISFVITFLGLLMNACFYFVRLILLVGAPSPELHTSVSIEMQNSVISVTCCQH